MLNVISRVAIFVSVFLVFALTGCAKRPATAPATAPAPTGAATTSAPTPGTPTPEAAQQVPHSASGPRVAAPTVTASATRPSPKQFTANSNLRDVYFDFDEYRLDRAGVETLDANAEWLKSNSNQLVLVEGHCDERGTTEYNVVLGERRAKAAMDYLVSRGVPKSRITITSYGEARPPCAERSASCWAKSRRAHFRITRP